MGAMGIFSSHLLKLYQFFDDFAWADLGYQPPKRRFGTAGYRIPALRASCLRCDMAKSVTAPTLYSIPAEQR
jgi:hypothetical protein